MNDEDKFNTDETRVVDIGGSIFVRIPAWMAKKFGLKSNTPCRAEIEYINAKTARIKFE